MPQACEVPVSESPPAQPTTSVSNVRAADSRTWPGRLLLVSDGSFDSDGAIAAALALARPAGASVELLITYAPRIPLPSLADRCGVAQCEPCDRQELARILRATRDRVRHVVSARADRADWTLRVEIGDPGATVVRVADQMPPDVVVVGIGQREVFDERAGGRTAVCAARYLDAPLLAAARHYRAPDRCVIALPHGRVNARTIASALACMPHGGLVYLAFPGAIPSPRSLETSSPDIHRIVMDACGPRIAAKLDRVELVRVDVAGDMLTSVLELADDVGATLIAVPIFGRPGPVRAFLPNLAEPLLFAAQCSVLVVPG